MENQYPLIPSADADSWTVAQGWYRERPTLVRYRPSLRRFCGDTRYQRRLTIKWSYDQCDDSGLPSDDQSERLGHFEDSIQTALDPDRLGVLAFVFTTAGVREWNYYVSDLDEVSRKVNAALTDSPNLPITLEAHSDPEWTEFSNALESITGENA